MNPYDRMDPQVLVTIPPDASVFVLEDDEERLLWFRRQLGARFDWAAGADDAIKALVERGDPYDVMFLDHDLSIVDRSYRLEPTHEFNSGSTFAKSFVEANLVARHVIVHSWNPGGAANMARIFETYGVQIAYLPFGTFKIRRA